MKILHTADWHLNDRLRRQDRTQHLRDRVERIAEICDREQVDVLLIAGDVFSDLATAPQVADSFRHLRRTFAGFLARGGVAIAVTGNHDQDGRIRPYLELARAGMDLAEPPKARGDRFSPGKAYLLDTAFIGRVHDPQELFDVQFVLLPFPSPSRLLTGEETGTTASEHNRSIQDMTAGWLRSLGNSPGYDVGRPTVLMAHLHVSGADVGRGMFRLSEEQDVILDEGALPTGFAYVALGHVHKPQCIRGMSHVRYAGSLDRMDFGEKDDEKSIILVEIGPKGRRGEPRVVPIESTPLVDLRISDPSSDRDTIASLVPNAREALVRVEVSSSAAIEAGDALERAIHEALPNVTWVERRRPEPIESPSARVVIPQADLRATVLDYLRRQLREDDPQRDDLLALAAQFVDRGDQK